MEHAAGILDVLKSAPAYLLVLLVGLVLFVFGTFRFEKIKVAPHQRQVINPVGIILITIGILLIVWNEVAKTIVR
uniref:Uncharacterized protein n=1 Tax=viral metagenome TaxID=1070528 RepID=A0A6M3KAS2_9ZZZZ